MPPSLSLAERVRRACLEVARRAYDEAGAAGLCEDGRLEAALSAIRELDLDALVAAVERGADDAPEGTP